MTTPAPVLALVLALALPGSLPVAAQETDPSQSDPNQTDPSQPARPDFTDATGGSLRFLDKLTSETGDVTLGLGQTAKFGRLVVRLDQCRYPTGNPASDAEAHLTILEEATQSELFNGWMLASSPALSALDHPRYDVWVLTCVLPEAPAATSAAEGQ